MTDDFRVIWKFYYMLSVFILLNMLAIYLKIIEVLKFETDQIFFVK
jgi:hypothetical protein